VTPPGDSGSIEKEVMPMRPPGEWGKIYVEFKAIEALVGWLVIFEVRVLLKPPGEWEPST
jgi:hypothetical protein